MARLLTLIPHAMALFMAGVFLDSLRYKFTDHIKTQEIFGRLDGWAGSIGAPGIFQHAGLFSQYVIGSAELVASVLLVIGILPRYQHLQALGALIGLAIMAGAVSFHLFTPLGIDPNNDGAGLFIAACINLSFAFILLFVFRRAELGVLLGRVASIFGPTPRP